MITPLGTHVLLEPISEQSLIELPETSKGQAEKAIVLGIGDGVEEEGLKVGDMVIFKKYSPEEFEMDGKVVYLIENVDLMGIYAKAEGEQS